MDSQTSPALAPAPQVSSGGVTPLPLQNISATRPLGSATTPESSLSLGSTPLNPSPSYSSTPTSPTPVERPLPGGLPPRPAPGPSPSLSSPPPLTPSPMTPPSATPPVPPAGDRPVKVAAAPRSPIFMIAGALIVLLLLLGGGYYVWSLIGPQSAPITPSPTPISSPRPTTLPTEPDSDVACTMEAKLCPDGSYVGRGGPDCDFDLCPGEQTKGGVSTGSSGSTSGAMGSIAAVNPVSPTTPAATPVPNSAWDVYKNPTYFLTFSYPSGWEVRDLKPYPRTDVKFRHGYGPRQSFVARGWVEASSLPVAELIEQVKKEEGGTATDQPGQMLGSYSVSIVRITNGTTSVDHWFVRAHDLSYHFTATGSVSEVAEIAKTYKIQ